MDNRTDIFWNCFSELKDKLMDIDSLSDEKAEELMLSLDKSLKECSSGVDFIIGDLEQSGRKLTLTANGDINFFQDVIFLCENAPILDFWVIQAFLPAQGKNQVFDDGETELKSKDLFFLPMESDTVKDKIGIRIAGKDLKINDSDFSCAYLLCEKMIGEYNATTMIDYFDLVDLPDNFEKEGFLPLDYLPDFVQWKMDLTENKSKEN